MLDNMTRRQKIEKAHQLSEYIQGVDLTKSYLQVKVKEDLGIDSIGAPYLLGLDLVRVLQRQVDELDKSSGLSEDDIGGYHTIDDLTSKYNVSKAAIRNWLNEGLVGRKLLIGSWRRVFLESDVAVFEEHNEKKIQAATNYQKMSEQTRRRLLTSQKSLEASSVPLALQVKILAEKYNKSEIAIRSIICKPTVCPEEVSREIKGGKSREEISEKYGIPLAAVNRIVNKEEKDKLDKIEITFFEVDYTPNNSFSYETTVLTKEEEKHLFQQYNYCKKKASENRREDNITTMRQWLDKAAKTRKILTEKNLRLVSNRAAHVFKLFDIGVSYDDLYSEGCEALLSLIDKFNPNKDIRFSSYAYVSLGRKMRKFCEESKKKSLATIHSDFTSFETKREIDTELLYLALDSLTEKERMVVELLYQLNSNRRHTAKDIYSQMGTTKQAIDQISRRAIKKLKAFFDQRQVTFEFMQNLT